MNEFKHKLSVLSTSTESELPKFPSSPFPIWMHREEDTKFYIFIIRPEDISKYEEIRTYLSHMRTYAHELPLIFHSPRATFYSPSESFFGSQELELPKIVSPFRDELSRIERKITRLENMVKRKNDSILTKTLIPTIGVISSLLIMLIAISFFSSYSMWVLLLGAILFLGLNFKSLFQ